jgi:Outer membrane protein beta-barrel domain
MRMKKPLIGLALALVVSWASNLQAQDRVWTESPSAQESNAVSFNTSSISSISLVDSPVEVAQPANSVLAASPDPAPADPGAPAPAAKPRYIFGDRDDYRWQLGVGVEFLRFQSSRFNASLVGLSTTVTYFTNDWFALEGSLATGFAPTIYTNDSVKYFGGSGGIRVGSRRARFEPFGHVLFGGAHLQPQTAGASRNSWTIQAGIGLDYRINARLSLRGQTDWVRTAFFSQSQNNFQAVGAVVFHF